MLNRKNSAYFNSRFVNTSVNAVDPNRSNNNIQYMQSTNDNDMINRHPSSQSTIALNNFSSNNMLSLHNNNNNNSHGNYVDIDTLDQMRHQSDLQQQYNQQISFDRNYSLNQNHQHTFDNQQQLHNYSGEQLSPFNKQFSTRNQMTASVSPAISPHASQLQLTTQFNKCAKTLPSPSYNSNGSPIYENQPSQMTNGNNVGRPESPIYINTSSPVYHPDNIIQTVNSVYQTNNEYELAL